jgi:hypothetical protein
VFNYGVIRSIKLFYEKDITILKNILGKNENIIQWLSGLGLPIALIISSWLVSTSIENTKVDSEYVKLAISILNNDANISGSPQTQPVTPEKEAMRLWAIRILDAKSPVKLTEQEKHAFVKEGIDFKEMMKSVSAGELELMTLKFEGLVKEKTDQIANQTKD